LLVRVYSLGDFKRKTIRQSRNGRFGSQAANRHSNTWAAAFGQ
jgi:hypothetical protein